MKTLALICVVLSLAVGCSSSGSAPDPKEGSGLACDHFRNIAGDVSKGLLNDTELRGKLKQVNDDAAIATPAVQAAAEHMLRAITAKDNADLTTAIGEMGDACSAAGH